MKIGKPARRVKPDQAAQQGSPPPAEARPGDDGGGMRKVLWEQGTRYGPGPDDPKRYRPSQAENRLLRGEAEPELCRGHKKDGSPCAKYPMLGASVCREHGGSAPQVRRKAAERLVDASDKLVQRLLKLSEGAESEAVRLRAIMDALDRAGLGAAQLIKLGYAQDDPWHDLLNEIMDDNVLPRRTSAHDAPTDGMGVAQGDEDDWLPPDDPDHEPIDAEVVEPEPVAPVRPIAVQPAQPRGRKDAWPNVPIPRGMGDPSDRRRRETWAG